jgi:hypothetical protein
MPVSLLDIAPPEVIRGTKLIVRGITNLELAILYKRFPVFAKQVATQERRTELLALPALTAGQAAELERLTIAPEDDLSTNAEIAPLIIAAGLGKLGDEKYEAAVSVNLSKAEQRTVQSIVMRLTSDRKVPSTVKEFEGALRNLGFSDEQARIIAASGFKEGAGPLAPGVDQAAAGASETSSPQP